MSVVESVGPTRRNSDLQLRLWPGIVLVAMQWALRFVLPAIVPEAALIGILGGLGCGAAVLVWWLFFSRVPRGERWGMVLLGLALLGLVRFGVDASIRGGAMGMLLPIYAIPVLCLGLVAGLVLTQKRSARQRRVAVGTALALGCGAFLLLRTEGMDSAGRSDLRWRWAKTREERLLAEPILAPKQAVARIPVTAVDAGWPGFRGPRRDSVLRGARIETDWTRWPPREVWRKPVGPAWSSFAVSGALIYTQEQRGEQEVVSCYHRDSGELVWRHGDPVRFYESNAGAGPRGTPTWHEGRIYTLGGTGVLNALDALTGAVVWRRDAAADTKKKAPDWGFSSSPLVIGDLVIVAATGSLVAYDRATGEPRWFGPADGKSYSSPHLLEVHGVPQVLLMSGKGLTSVTPREGSVLWQHAWEGFAIVQPAQIENGHLLISTGDRVGVRRIGVANTDGKWTVDERWTSNRLKPYFNDLVLHRGHAFGFDNGILACVELESGKPRWKGGRYGRGQVLLLADQDVLLVVSEQGGLALVRALPDEFAEIARAPALEGKTWNHPVLVDDLLLVRNDQEMVALRLRRTER